MIDGNGLHPLTDKIKSIRSVPDPKNVTELKSFLGMLQFYSQFLDNMATTIEPLTRLLRNNCVLVGVIVNNNHSIVLRDASKSLCVSPF